MKERRASDLLEIYQSAMESGQFPGLAELRRFGLTAHGNFFETFEAPEIPSRVVDGQRMPAWHALVERAVHGYALRDEFVKRFGFAVLSSEAVEALRVEKCWIEIGAGSGAWTRGLVSAGLDVIGSDPQNVHYRWEKNYVDLLRLDGAKAVKRYRDRNVLCVWPTLGEPWARKAAAEIGPGKLFALVHEGSGGCVGDDSLYETLEQLFERVDEVGLPCFPGIHDRLTIYQRSTERLPENYFELSSVNAKIDVFKRRRRVRAFAVFAIPSYHPST